MKSAILPPRHTFPGTEGFSPWFSDLWHPPYISFLFFWNWVALRALHMLAKCPSTRLYPKPHSYFLFWDSLTMSPRLHLNPHTHSCSSGKPSLSLVSWLTGISTQPGSTHPHLGFSQKSTNFPKNYLRDPQDSWICNVISLFCREDICLSPARLHRRWYSNKRRWRPVLWSLLYWGKALASGC